MELKYIAGEIPWTLPFEDHFHSTDLQRDNELEIIARRHGFEQLINLENKSNWSNTGVYSYDDYNHTFCYLCSVNAHQHERTQPRDESQRRKLIPYKNPKARLSSSSLDRLGQHPSSDLISYRFIVRTGTEKNSGTRAQVFLYMYGTEKNWSSIHLQERLNTNSSASIDGFPSGSSRTFCLKGPDIGQLHHMNVNLVGSRSKKEWFLKDIEITNLKTSTSWLCEFNCWLPKADNQDIDQTNMRIFPRHTDSPFTSKSLENYSIYILQVRTGEKAFASTDANIHITIRGSKNKSNRLRLSNDRVNLFEQNQLDTFAIVGEHLGDLLEISIESDKSQLASDWDIKELTMWKLSPANENDQSHVYFPINSWLGKKIPALKAKREVYPLVDPHLKGPICYQIIVKTGKVTNAGTDANVFLIIYGKSGRTAVHQLNNRSKNDFERNTSSEFTIMDIDIGEIDRIKIWHDNSNLNSAWFLDSIIIQKKYSTCHIISDIYIQRLEQISKAIDRRISEQRKKTRHESKSHSVDRQNSRVKDDVDQGSTDRLGNSRGILRSPTMYDRASLQKKVTWDEQSIGSLDDLYSMDSQRTKSLQNLNEQKYKKMESFQEQFHPNDYQIYWISSHNYRDNHWKIKSIEEIDPFDLEQSTRLSLLSDRSVINNKTKRPVRDNDDEIYEFQANRWLAKDKEDGKLEVYLTPKSIRRSSLTSDTNIDTKKKPPIPSSRHFDIPHSKHDHIEKDSKRLLSSDVGPIERSSRSQSSSLHSHSIAARQNSLLKQKEESSRDKFPLSSPLSSRAKSSPNVNNSMNALNDEQDLLARLTDEPSQHPRSSVSPLSPINQRVTASRNINDQQSPAEISRKPRFNLDHQLLYY
ncbi:hypothetical protein I4U23_018964 [Adineta vaga]|nr:hypothetical protein I4U23_018964 [Adineta vaga]